MEQVGQGETKLGSDGGLMKLGGGCLVVAIGWWWLKKRS